MCLRLRLGEHSFIFRPATGKRAQFMDKDVMLSWRLGMLATLLTLLSGHSGAQGFRGEVIAPPPMGEPWSGPLPPSPPPQFRPRMETPQLLNDTPEYCAELRQSIDRVRLRLNVVPPDVTMLAEEGERLCSIGHYRPGIMRLRTALMLLRNAN